MPTIYELGRAFQAQVVAGDRVAAGEVVRAYQPAYRALLAEVDRLDARIREAVAAGETVDPVWIFQQGRYQELQRQIAVEVGRFAGQAAPLVDARQREMVAMAARHSRETADAAGIGASWASVPTEAIMATLGHTAAGSPLADLFARLAPMASEDLRGAIVAGLATGTNPLDIAPRLRGIAAIPVVRARTIARTEMLRSYREGSRAIYGANSDLLDGWIWLSAKGRDTCPACWAMHGTFHPLSEPMGAHPNCRCTMVPSVRGQEDLIAPGPAEFANLTPARQEAILGRKGYGLYTSGRAGLEDFADVRTDARWGTSIGQASGVQALRNRATGRALTYARPVASPAAPPPKPSAIIPRIIPTSATAAPPAPPARIALPAGTTPVGAALTIPRTSRWDAIRRAVRAIDETHGDGQLPTIPVKETKAANKYGSFSYRRSFDYMTGRMVEESWISMNFRLATHQEMTTAHEVGHFLDWSALGRAGNFATRAHDPEMAAVLDATANSRAVRSLGDLVAGPPAGMRVNGQYATYMLDPAEQWARAYAQYVTVKSGDPVMAAQLAHELVRPAGSVYYAKQWDPDDFLAIERAIDELFRRKGWIA